MKGSLLRSSAFVKAARRLVARSPGSAEALALALGLLAEDPFDPRLRTHKLKGPLAGSWACSAGYDLRIVFTFVEVENGEAILLETVGTHEEIY